ncbi:hypothetical protein ELI35_37850 [Rhizobium ruizarguesonis]|nr:hypothetical protein ELI35_37850 [Rhizobium ruizarguesonis]
MAIYTSYSPLRGQLPRKLILSTAIIAQLSDEARGRRSTSSGQAAGFTKFGTRISVSRGHRFQKVRDSDFTKSRTKIAADLDRFS